MSPRSSCMALGLCIGALSLLASLLWPVTAVRQSRASPAASPLTPLHGFYTTDNPGHSWGYLVVLWDLTPIDFKGNPVLSAIENSFSCHNALTLLPMQGPPHAWIIPGGIDDVWHVSSTRYVILDRCWGHGAPYGSPLHEELLGLNLQDNSLVHLWSFQGKVGVGTDGTDCGVVITWYNHHISLRSIPDKYSSTTIPFMDLALYAGTNTCR